MESAFRRRDFVFEAGDNSSGRRQTGVMIELHSTHRGRAVMSVNTALLRTLRKNLLLESLAGAGFLAHMAVADRYGYFRDELYYIAAGHHLALGYVDFPVMIAILAWVLRGLAGDSLVAIHVIPALANADLTPTASGPMLGSPVNTGSCGPTNPSGNGSKGPSR